MGHASGRLIDRAHTGAGTSAEVAGEPTGYLSTTMSRPFLLALTVCAGLACAAPEPTPPLVVVISVDQMRADYLDRFGDLFTGGLSRLLERGAVFTNAHHAHGITDTATGHATISTGVHPARSGIVGNEWYDRAERRSVYAVADTASPIAGYAPNSGRSPRRLLRPTVGDWLKAASPESRVFSVALKDRAAILLGGHRADGVYWYFLSTGRIVTSAYYDERAPAWVETFNTSRPAAARYHDTWTRLLPEESYDRSREDDFAAERNRSGPVFPHWMATDGDGPTDYYYRFTFPRTPFADERTLAFAREVVEHEAIGADSIPDLLFIGCSAADFLGHVYGPYSHEVQDYYLRLDGYLGAFFDFLDERVRPDRYVVVFTADHGVSPLPEELVRRGTAAGRYNGRVIDRLADSVVRASFDAGEISLRPRVRRVGHGLTFVFEGGHTLPGNELRVLRRRVAAAVVDLPFIAAAHTFDELSVAGTDDTVGYRAAMARSFHPDRSGDVVLVTEPHFVAVSSMHNTTHGSPYPYDTHVPLILAGPGVAAGTHSGRVHTVDVAPTIAAVLGISPPGDLDGRSLIEIIRP